MPFHSPSQIMELNIISGQDLFAVARSMKTYATVWINPVSKLTTRVDATGGTNPIWNDKFVFRLGEDSLSDDSSTLVIEIYAMHWFKDVHIGTVQALIRDLVSPSSGMRFLTLDVVRTCGRPHGRVNIAVGLVDSILRSMPLYAPSLLDEHPTFRRRSISSSHNHRPNGSNPILRRSKSETSSMIGSGVTKAAARKIIGATDESDSNFVINSGWDTSTASGKNGFSSDSQMVALFPPEKTPEESQIDQIATEDSASTAWSPMRPKFVGIPIITDSELGPSASVVADQIARKTAAGNAKKRADNLSVKGFRSKLKRWAAEPPIEYDVDSLFPVDTNYEPKNYGRRDSGAIGPLRKKHSRRHSDGDVGGLFSCFSNICGIECSIVCGSGPKRSKKSKSKG